METTIKCDVCSGDLFWLINVWVPDGHSDSGLKRHCQKCGTATWIFKGVIAEGKGG